MKVRKAICAAVALGGVATLALGIAGVFAPEKKAHPPPEVTEESPEPGSLLITDFILRRGTLAVRAKQATVTLEGDTVLTEPRVEMEVAEEAEPSPDGNGEPPRTKIRARANQGFQSGEDDLVIILEGDVEIEATGHRSGSVLAERLVWDHKEGQGTFEGQVEFSFETPDGIQSGSCRGAEWNMRLRRGAMHSDVELVLAGWGLPSLEGEDNAPSAETDDNQAPAPVAPGAAEPVLVRCDGEAAFDGVAGLAKLSENVTIEQGEAELRCGTLEFVLDPATNTLLEVVASQEVAFSSGEHALRGRCDRMVRRVDRETVELTGEPHSEVHYQGLALRASHIVLRGETVAVWGAGEAEFAPPDESASADAPDAEEGDAAPWGGASGTVRVEWGGRMEFSRANRRADFRRDVRLREGQNEVSCRDLTVWLDEAGSRPERAEAAGDVRFAGDHGEGVGERLTVAGGMESFRLEGRPAVLTRDEDRFEGRELAVEQGGGVLRSQRPGKIAVGSPDAPADPEGALGLAGGRIEAEWNDAMLYRAEEETLALTGAVRIRSGEGELDGESIEFARKTGKVEVRGPGRLSVWTRPSAPDRENAEGDDAASFLGIRESDEPSRIEIQWQEGMAYFETERSAEFFGGASLRHENYRLDAERLSAQFDEHRDLAGGAAEGNVVMEDRTRGYRGRGHNLEWDAGQGMAWLRGTEDDPAELDSGDGLAVLSRLFTFSNGFRTVTMEAPRSRPQHEGD